MQPVGVIKCTWERDQWDQKKEIRVDNAPVRIALVVKTLEIRPFVQIVDFRPDTLYHVYPRRDESGKKSFEIRVMKDFSPKKKKPKRYS